MIPFAVRRHTEMKDVLMNPNAIGPEVHYYMIRGGNDKTNITIWETGNVGGEYIKTYGHYHVGDLDETYYIAGGEGILLLQKRRTDDRNIPIDADIEYFIAINVKVGDKINIPTGIGHLVVNIGPTWLVTIDNSPLLSIDDTKNPSHADYGPVKKLHGFAYYIVDQNGPKFIKNTNYKVVPDVKMFTVEKWQKICR